MLINLLKAGLNSSHWIIHILYVAGCSA